MSLTEPNRETRLEETRLWRERYRVLFDRNIAGIILTNVDGRIMDCNEPCARIFGFHSRKEMLTHSAWEFYFDRAERNAIIDRLRTRANCHPEEVCLRDRNGRPIWVLATRTLVSFTEGQPYLLQGTLIDITEQKKARARLRDIRGAEAAVRMAQGENARMADLSRRLAALLRSVSKTLQPNNLLKTDRAEIQQCVLALEQMKMLMCELELIHLLPE